ncbi:MAG: zinc metalloprotease HtpX [Candidatus Aenigmatarchaeota archaeon]
MAILRTTLLLGLLTGILLAAGFLFGGMGGMTLALIIAFVMNFAAYWWSDKIVLRIYRAKPSKDPTLNSIVENLARKAEIPKPKTYIVPTAVPNAFATGRSPKHAAVAATQGLLDHLNKQEIEGVLAHEIAHVKNRDTLVSAMAATIAGSISYLAHFAWYSLFWGDSRNSSSLMLLPLVMLAPFAAMMVQLAISRGREFSADYTGAIVSGKPDALASALNKISTVAKNYPLRGNSATSHMWIVNPFRADSFSKLFSTHPPIEQRIARLKELAKEIK